MSTTTEIPHGLTGYSNGYKCRCLICRAAQTAYTREYRLRPIDPDKCGSHTNYQRGCRCEPCREHHNASRRASYRRSRQACAIREWAKANGYPVTDVGRLPLLVVAAYEAAQGAGGGR